MQKQGRLKHWNDEKGFGFIADSSSGPEIFIHISAFKNRTLRPQVNQTIIYTPTTDKSGRLRASQVCIMGDKNIIPKAKSRPKNRLKLKAKLLVGFSVVFMMVTTALVIINRLPVFILYLYAILSTVAFAFYRVDKSAARLGYWRTTESVLFMLSLIGGWPGAIVAQQLMRHKSRKLSFRLKHLVFLLLNLTLFGWLFTEQGQSIVWFIDANIKQLISHLIDVLFK